MSKEAPGKFIFSGSFWANWANVFVVLNSLYKYLCETIPEFDEICSTAVKIGVTLVLNFLGTVLNKIAELCKENKVFITFSSKLSIKVGAAKAGVITVGTKVAMKSLEVALEFVLKSAMKAVKIELASESVKTVLKFGPGVILMVPDVAQAGLEVFGHKKFGKTIGKWGNIGTGAAAGFAVYGPVGIPVGALVGFGSWILGEGVGPAIEEMLK